MRANATDAPVDLRLVESIKYSNLDQQTHTTQGQALATVCGIGNNNAPPRVVIKASYELSLLLFDTLVDQSPCTTASSLGGLHAINVEVIEFFPVCHVLKHSPRGGLLSHVY